MAVKDKSVLGDGRVMMFQNAKDASNYCRCALIFNPPYYPGVNTKQGKQAKGQNTR